MHHRGKRKKRKKGKQGDCKANISHVRSPLRRHIRRALGSGLKTLLLRMHGRSRLLSRREGAGRTAELKALCASVAPWLGRHNASCRAELSALLSGRERRSSAHPRARSPQVPCSAPRAQSRVIKPQARTSTVVHCCVSICMPSRAPVDAATRGECYSES